MDTNSINYFFRDWYERHDDLMSLPLYRMYKIFSGYYTSKQNEVDICFHSIQKNTPHYNIILPVCRAADRTLKQLYHEISKDLDNKCKPFEYICYFFYDKIKNIISRDNYQSFYETLELIKSFHSLPNDCEITNFKIDEQTFNKKGKLYYHSEILYWIKKKSLLANYYIEKYDKYFYDCINDYNEIINGNYCEYVQHYEPVIDQFSNNFEEIKLSLTGTQLKILTQDIKLKRKPSCPQIDMRNTEPESGSLLEQGDLKKMSTGEPRSADNLPMHIPNNEKGKILGTTFGIFTPFGSWLYDKIKIKKNIYLEDKIDDLILNTYQNEDTNAYKEMYNITYQST
ncbi:PIR Superfamily Protein [Plasmodium ovale curtisi]|uniref:PIR Superfamily Protein n=1 Tax=Plasmodium ovale curtisi TaxID=864141 RepID=A0A1A8X4R6_PLAOA|nr:PIR Superfamily Protein [Plasmodium ovale curtisi]SBS99589.1 PIR Superfamily Protein [Plasmodium ovale curtisi]